MAMKMNELLLEEYLGHVLFYNDDVKVRKYVDMTKKALEIQEQENVNLIQKVIQLKEEIALLQDLTDQKLSFSFCNQSTI